MRFEYLCKQCNRKMFFEELLKFCPICGEKDPIPFGRELVDEILILLQDEDSLQIANIVTYELGDLIKKLFYAKIYPKRQEVCLIEARIAFSDLIAQCHLICKREGWNFAEVESLGLSRAYEKISGRKKGNG